MSNVSEKDTIKAIIGTVWPDEVEIIGDELFDALLESDRQHYQDESGHNYDFREIIETISAPIDLVKKIIDLIGNKKPSNESEVQAIIDQIRSSDITFKEIQVEKIEEVRKEFYIRVIK